MYNIPYFKANDPRDIISFMKGNPFITLIGVAANQQPVATQIPVLIIEKEGKLYLQGHLMRKQDHTNAFELNPIVLALFTSNHAYVSASWYADQQVASTWNYKAVHAKGYIRFMDNDGLYDLLVALTNHFEGSEDSPAAVKYLCKDYVQNNMKAIVGIEIEITSIEHVFKLSQNRDEDSKQNIKEKIGGDLVL